MAKRIGFSLIELLVALAVLAVVAAIIVPKFLNLQAQSQETVAAQMASQLNSTLASWQAAGGNYSGASVTSDLLAVLTGVGSNSGTASDGGTSSTMRTSPPQNLDSSNWPQRTVTAGNYAIVFDGTSFVVNTAADIAQKTATLATDVGTIDTSLMNFQQAVAASGGVNTNTNPYYLEQAYNETQQAANVWNGVRSSAPSEYYDSLNGDIAYINQCLPKVTGTNQTPIANLTQ